MIEVEDEFSDLPLALRKIAKRTKNAFMCPNLFAIIIDKSITDSEDRALIWAKVNCDMIEVEDEFSDLPLALRKIAKRTKNAFMCPNLFAIIIDKSNKMRN